jgi:hypothetical protein
MLHTDKAAFRPHYAAHFGPDLLWPVDRALNQRFASWVYFVWLKLHYTNPSTPAMISAIPAILIAFISSSPV